MTEYPNLKNPPITEAVIDIRCVRSDAAHVSKLEATAVSLGTNYYIKGAISQAQIILGSESDQAPSGTSTQKIGVRLHSRDEKYVIQWTLDGCALSRLEPYESWEALSIEAQRIWPIYLDAIKPNGISRTAVRYINNLRLPMSYGEKFDDYLTAAPQIAEGLSQAAGSFLQRVVIRDPKTSALGAITHAYESSQGIVDGAVPVILDIDVFSEREFNVSDNAMWQHLEQLRTFKNMIFFCNLTDKAVSSYL